MMIVAIAHTTSRHTTSTTTGTTIAALFTASVVILTIGVVIIVEDCNVMVAEYLVGIVLWLVTSDMRTTVVGINWHM